VVAHCRSTGKPPERNRAEERNDALDSHLDGALSPAFICDRM
jgi:hypothetical protein